jgi:phosphate acyltransferase
MKLALDVMGGDHAPQNNIGGVKLALASLPQIERLYLVGQPEVVQAELERQGVSSDKLQIVPAASVIAMDDAATDAIRKKRDSSISVAMELVKSGECAAVVSPGHTGASVAAGTFILGRMKGVERPGIASPFPGLKGATLLIDAGANTAPKASHLVQYAIMGSVFMRSLFQRERPRVGLMSVGEEEGKGNDLTREAYDLLKAVHGDFTFLGNIEGTNLYDGSVDVVVCDGFVGNVVLKTAKAFGAMFKEEVLKLPTWRKLGGKLIKPASDATKVRTSYETYGGSPLLGCKGTVIIGHGSSPPIAVMNALRVACESVQHQVNPHIEAALSSTSLS